MCCSHLCPQVLSHLYVQPAAGNNDRSPGHSLYLPDQECNETKKKKKEKENWTKWKNMQVLYVWFVLPLNGENIPTVLGVNSLKTSASHTGRHHKEPSDPPSARLQPKITRSENKTHILQHGLTHRAKNRLFKTHVFSFLFFFGWLLSGDFPFLVFMSSRRAWCHERHRVYFVSLPTAYHHHHHHHHYCLVQRDLRPIGVIWFLTSWLDNDLHARCGVGIRTWSTGRGIPCT